MNQFNFLVANATWTIVIAFMAGWAVGFLLWLLRYFVIEMPDSGNMKGGEYIKW